MKNTVYTALLFLGLFLSSVTACAQFDPEKICRVGDGRLIFTLDLKWTEKEKKLVSELFDLDSALLVQVYSGKSIIESDGESWQVKKTGSTVVELSKPVLPETGNNIRTKDLFILMDNWMKFSGMPAETDVVYGINNFNMPSAFVYTGTMAQLYLPGYVAAKKIFISGTFNNWSTQETPMKFMGKGWIVDLKLKPGKYAYKYIVDGKWTTDPGNNIRERGDAGAYNSVFYCANHIFRLKGYQNAHRVVITGNFYRWNPHGLPLNPGSDGWSLPVYFRDGTYTYKFWIDGKWMTDPANPSVREDAGGNLNSFLEIGEPYLFKLDGYTTAEKVILSGSFNRWSENELVMDKTPSGWQLPYVVPAGNYEYKFIVDGKWMVDPANPFTSRSGDTRNSFIALKANHIFELSQFPEARIVILTGSFNSWNQNGYRMVKDGGKWRLPVYLAPGKYTYKFIVDGTWMTDPGNNLYEQNEYGTNNSVLWIGPAD